MVRVLVVDDRQDFVEAAAGKITEVANDVEVKAVTGDSLKDLVDVLVAAQQEVPTVDFDDFDVVVLDYDLTQEGDIGLTTGADIARLMRSHTNCGAIVLTNPFPGPGRERRFDLRLVGNLDLLSDFEVASEFLGNRGLWSDADWPIFRPSTWPVVPGLVERLDLVTRLITERLDEPLLGVVPEIADHYDELSADDKQWLGADVNALRVRDVSGSEHGTLSLLAPRGPSSVPEDVVPRFVASRLIKWLDLFVRVRGIGLVGAAQLISRRPDVLLEEAQPDGEGSLNDVIEPSVLDLSSELSRWCSRTVWWASAVSPEAIAGKLGARPKRGIDLVFAEDLSQFIPRDSARSYLLSIESAYRRRWLASEELLKDSGGEWQPDIQPAQWLMM
jgi:hypothetical protein